MRYVFLILSLLVGYATSAKTIPVGRGHQYKTIAAGLEAAISGDTVLVEGGHYK